MIKFIISHEHNYYDLYEFILKDNRVLHIPAPIFNKILKDVDEFILNHIKNIRVRNNNTFECPICGKLSFYAGICLECWRDIVNERDNRMIDILWNILEYKDKITEEMKELYDEGEYEDLILRLEYEFTEDEIKNIEKELDIDYSYYIYIHERKKDRIKNRIMKWFKETPWRPTWIKEINYITNNMEIDRKEENNNINNNNEDIVFIDV